MTKDITLKAACADTFHYPQDWDPTRGSLDSFQRKRGFEHHFGKQRTKNLHKGILLIRFEMPFAVQCLRCEKYIGQGTRYNADKRKVGMYFSSPIYEFAFACDNIVGHEKSADGKIFCNQRLVIRTDPKNDDYALAEGLRRKNQTWEPEATETISLNDPETRRKMESDPMFRVEKTVRDARRERSDKERLRELEDLQFEREDTYALNSILRRRNRAERKEAEAEEEAQRLAGKPNFALPLEPATDGDRLEASAVRFRTDLDKVEVAARRAAVAAAPLFASTPATSSSSSSSSSVASSKRPRSLGGGSSSGSSSGRSSSVGSAREDAASTLQQLVAKRRRLAEHGHIARVFERRRPAPSVAAAAAVAARAH